MTQSQCSYYDTIHYKYHMQPSYFFASLSTFLNVKIHLCMRIY